jgi:adenosylhomocysteine nucleosidase
MQKLCFHSSQELNPYTIIQIVRVMNKQNYIVCIVFPMGIEAYPFLHRVEIRRRRVVGKTVIREAFFEGENLLIVRSGVGPVKAADAMKKIGIRPDAVINAGTAGALVNELRPGHLIVSSETVSGEANDCILKCDKSLTEIALRACQMESLPSATGRLATSSRPIFRHEDRRKFHLHTGAIAVDMESHAVGIEARKIGAPFTAIRVISDDLNCSPLGRKRDFREALSDPKQAVEEVFTRFRWWRFMRDFYRAVNLLPPVLIGILRELSRNRS